jgi:large-conductance mechanosensitive channel
VTNGYNTVKQALDDGAVVFAYGSFLDKLVRFICIALALWVIAIAYSRGSGDNIVKKQVVSHDWCKDCMWSGTNEASVASIAENTKAKRQR